jgi:signal transduction histidine kinase
MYKTEIIIFIVLTSVVMTVVFCGIMLFAVQYKRKRQQHEKEKQLLEERHRLALATAQAEIQQQTMHDIGRELHDHIGQKLTLASIYTQQLQHEKKESPDKLNQIGNIINQSLSDLRTLSKTLTDTSLDQSSLHELMQREGKKVNDTGRCRFTFESQIASISAGYNSKVFVLRILQEFTQNSLKHSKCRNILVTAQVTGNGLHIKMMDDGAGFNQETDASPGIGLENMKKRAELLGAEFSLTSTPGTGTELILVVPITQMNQ